MLYNPLMRLSSLSQDILEDVSKLLTLEDILNLSLVSSCIFCEVETRGYGGDRCVVHCAQQY